MAEVNANEKAQDLRLRTIDIPYPSIAQELVESVSSSSSSSELMLRLDDLSQDRPRDDRNTYEKGHKRNDDHDKEGKTSTQQQEAKCMETHLQRNLTQQQAHYARQRKVVENMCTTRDLSENSNSPQSSGDHESLVHHCDSSPRKLIDATDCCDQKTTTKSASVSRQRAPFTRDNRSHRQSSLLIDDINDDDDDDSHAQHMLRRIKEKARAEFRRQHLASQESCAAVRARVPTEFYEQEASSDALRRQLELLRRLQVENNRFRHDLRSLRERNDAFKQRDKVREREVTHLRNEVSKLEAIVERDQVSLATADKSAHRLKVTQKKLAVTQAETHDLLVALQEARDARDQLQSDSQAELSNLLVQVNRWKRNAKQLCQQENRTSDELEFYKKTIASLEEEATEHRSQLTEAKREIAKLSAVIEEKNALCESVEMSAADCVKQMEEDFEVLHKTSTQERQKRKKAESVCNKLQVQMERMQGENTLLLSKQRELERELALVKEQWKEGKQTYHDQLQRCTTELEDHVAKHKSDAAVINGLREEYERLETRFEKAEAKAVDLKSKVDDEARFAQEQVKALRVCVEKVLHDASRDDGSVVLENLAHLERSCREEVGHEMPELQVVISALRNAIMNALHDYRRVHHVVRQQDGKLALAVERVTELEHLREEDAARMIELRDQRKLAEQAREIMKQEKIEVLKWGEQTCERSERIEAELKQCGRVVLRLRKELRRALETDESLDELELMKAEALTQSLCVIQKDMDHLVSMRDHWRSKSEKLSHNVNKAKCQVETLAKELDASEDEFKKTLEELEGVHDKNIREQKLQFEQYIADMEGERSSLESKLEAEAMKFAEEQENSKRLQHVVDGFEQDLPVFATIFHLFLLVVQPLVLQVSDLLAQKRLLLRENADFAQTNGEIECIGQVLKEMMPATALSQKRMNERHRRRAFRRVVIAVFAMNRFQHCVVSATSCAREDLSPYGLCAPLKALETTKRSLQPTVIRVLPPQEIVSTST